jgi:outer membrane protein TolC
VRVRWVSPLCVLLVAVPARATLYSRDQLIARVRATYPGVRAAEKGVASARSWLKQAELGWAPSGELSLQVSGTPEIRCQAPPGFSQTPRVREENCLTTTYVDWGRPGQGNGFWNAAPIHGVLLGVNLTLQQPLYSFGKIEAQIQASKTAVRAAEEGVKGALAEAVVRALRAYWEIKWGRTSLHTIDEEIARLKSWTHAIEEEMDGDNLAHYSETDLARLKVAADWAEVQRLDIQRRLSIAEVGLRSATVDPTADVDDEELTLSEKAVQPLEWYREVASQHRPESRQLDLSVRAAQAERRARLADMLPDLSLIHTLTYSYASAQDTPLNYYFLRPTSLDMQWVLQLHVAYDFGPRHTKLQQARAGERAAIARREKGLIDIDVQVARAFADHTEAVTREAHLRHGERVAHGWYAIVDDNLQRGISVSSDTRELTDAARNYFDFRLRHLAAMLDVNLTRDALDRVGGVL